jgi:fatty-acid desaturase
LGTTPVAVAKGFWHAHLGWLFVGNRTNPARFAPDLLADPEIRRVNDTFLWWAAASLAVPALLGGLISWSCWGAITALFWAGLVRIAVLHHADPTCARHGALRGQIDVSARRLRPADLEPGENPAGSQTCGGPHRGGATRCTAVRGRFPSSGHQPSGYQ